eukprot:361810-Chlamydomonas_euryale.AAC.1
MPAIAWSVRLVAAASSVLYALCSCSPSMRPLPIVCSHCVRMKARTEHCRNLVELVELARGGNVGAGCVLKERVWPCMHRRSSCQAHLQCKQ